MNLKNSLFGLGSALILSLIVTMPASAQSCSKRMGPYLKSVLSSKCRKLRKVPWIRCVWRMGGRWHRISLVQSKIFLQHLLLLIGSHLLKRLGVAT